MEIANTDQIARQVAHFMAARRLQDRRKQYGDLPGFSAQAAFHRDIVAAIAREFCSGGELEARAPACATA